MSDDDAEMSSSASEFEFEADDSGDSSGGIDIVEPEGAAASDDRHTDRLSPRPPTSRRRLSSPAQGKQ
jgi:hypothetical protein